MRLKSCKDPKCVQYNPQPIHNYYEQPGNLDGHKNVCIECYKANGKRYRKLGKKKPPKPVLDWDKIMAADISV